MSITQGELDEIMREIKKIAIIGHFGGTESFLDGQTIKTKILYDELLTNTNWKIVKVDTYYKNVRPIKLLMDSLKCLLTTRHVIVLLSGNGMKFYFPLLYICSKFLGTRVYHDLIGGDLDDYVRRHKESVRQLNSFCLNWVETHGLKQRLEKEGIVNCDVLPNFKRLNIVRSKRNDNVRNFNFCIFSRVMKEKGIEDAINAIQKINEQKGKIFCTLDIYGKIDDGYIDRFDTLMKEVSAAIQYKGTVPYSRSTQIIKRYYALLFPTYWHGEGFPGTIVDAFSAGLPVIATDWNCNSEIIKHKVNGLLYPNEGMNDLYEAIIWAIDNVEIVNGMRSSCNKSAELYQPDRYIEKIIKQMEENN